MTAQNKALARRVFEEAFNAGNLDVIDEVATDTFVNYDAALPEPGIGIEAAKASIAAYRDAFPDLKLTIKEQIAEGDRVVTRWIARGTHKGELMGMPPTGRQATVTGITIDLIQNGRISESRTNWDTLGLLQQLGAIPATATV